MSKIRRYFVPSLEKGLEILEDLAACGSPKNLVHLARSLNRTSSELFRMLDCLQRCGYISRDRTTGCYSLTLKLYELAHTHPPIEKLLHSALPLMRKLARELNQPCHLSTFKNGHIIILARVESPRPIQLSIEIGARFPASRTASGRMLLSQLTNQEAEEQLAQDPAYMEMSHGKQKKLRKELARIRGQGYSVAENETIMGVHDTAVLAGNPKAGIIAALAIPLLTSAQPQDQRQKILDGLRRCSLQIQKAAGLCL